MCLTSGPAKLSGTKILAMRLENQQHLIAYSNSVENTSGRPNSMILPVPGKLSKEDFFDTTAYPHFMDEIEEQIKPKVRSKSFSRSLSANDDLSFENFQLGNYNVFISESAQTIGKAIEKLEDSKRPEISKDILSFLDERYKGWSFVICCFDAKDKVSAQPVMFKYTPLNKDILFFPAIDSHDGKAPDMGRNVHVDHYIITNIENPSKSEVPFTEPVPEFLKDFNYVGMVYDGYFSNGDFYLSENTNYKFIRQQEVMITVPVEHQA